MSRVAARLDLRLLPLGLAVWGSCAWAVTQTTTRLGVVLGTSALLAAVSYRYFPQAHPAWRSVTVTTCLGICFGCVLAYPQLSHRAGPLPQAQSATVQVALTSYPKPLSGAQPHRLWASGTLIDLAQQPLSAPVPVQLFVPASWTGLTPGQQLTTTARIRHAEPGSKTRLVLTATGTPQQITAAPWWHRVGGGLRARFRTADHGVPAHQSALVAGLIIGADDGQSPALAEAMRRSGLIHLTAVSGSNTATVVALSWFFATFCGAARWLRGLSALGALAGYLMIVGPEPSLLRATVMGILGLVGALSSRSGRHVNALALAIIVLCTVDPWLSRATGFTLSVLATLAILLTGPGLTAALVRYRIPRAVAAVIAMSLAATVACAPVIALIDGQLSFVAVLANVLVAPLVPIVTVLGLLMILPAACATSIGSAGLFPAHLAAQGIEFVAYRCAALPGAAVPVPTSGSSWLLLGGALGAILLCWLWWQFRTPQLSGQLNHRPAAGLIAVATAVVVASFTLAPGFSSWVRTSTAPPADWLVVVCDVGQGTAVLIRTDTDRAVLYDTGPADGNVLHCLNQAGVKQLDALILSHFHQDHVGATRAILAAVPVHSAWVSAAHAPAFTAATVLATLTAHHVPISTPQRGDQKHWGQVTATMLTNPVPLACAATECSGTQINDQSVVVRFDHPTFSSVLTGDIELASQDTVVALTPTPEPVDLLLTPHHGSAKQRQRFLALWKPRVHVICVGKDNDYGHPHPKTLAMLASVGGTVLRTDQHGQIAVTATSIRRTRP